MKNETEQDEEILVTSVTLGVLVQLEFSIQPHPANTCHSSVFYAISSFSLKEFKKTYSITWTIFVS